MGIEVGLGDVVLLWSLFFVFPFALSGHGFAGNDLTTTMKHTTLEEEAVIETFHVDDGIIDCIDVTKQRALKHPLLINHTLQMKPSYYPGTMRLHDSLVGESNPCVLPKRCPGGSIPVWRAHWINGYFTHNTPASHLYLSSNHSLQQRNYDIKQLELTILQPS